jgi:ABC-type Fe3+ transport system substrate-binding protein
VDFMLSAEGQSSVRERGRTPARAHVAGAEAASNLKLHQVNPKLAREFSEAEREFRDIFLKGQ